MMIAWGALILAKWEAGSMEVRPRLLSRLFEKDFSSFRGIRRVGRQRTFSGNGALNARMNRSLINVGYPSR